MGNRLGAAVGVAILSVVVSACGGGEARPGAEGDEPTSEASASQEQEVELLGPTTPLATAEELSERDLCINASDLTYLVSALAQQAPTDGDFNDPDFLRLVSERSLATAEALSSQLPADLKQLGDDAVQTFETFQRLAEPVEYAPDDAAAFNAEFNRQTAEFQRGNSQLVAELGTDCDPELPKYADGLTLPLE